MGARTPSVPLALVFGYWGLFTLLCGPALAIAAPICAPTTSRSGQRAPSRGGCDDGRRTLPLIHGSGASFQADAAFADHGRPAIEFALQEGREVLA